MDWNDWLTYVQNSDHVLTWNGDGYQLHWEHPCGASQSVEFWRRRTLVNHLCITAMQDLREDMVMQRDARYAVTTGDWSFIAKAIDEQQEPPSVEALAAHHIHHVMAKRQFRHREDLQLTEAAALSREFCTSPVAEHYGRRIKVESARQSAQLLRECLDGADQEARPRILRKRL